MRGACPFQERSALTCSPPVRASLGDATGIVLCKAIREAGAGAQGGHGSFRLDSLTSSYGDQVRVMGAHSQGDGCSLHSKTVCTWGCALLPS